MAVTKTVKHTSTYTLCTKLIARGNTEGLAEKIDVFLLANRITEDEYKELMEMLTPKSETE